MLPHKLAGLLYKLLIPKGLAELRETATVTTLFSLSLRASSFIAQGGGSPLSKTIMTLFLKHQVIKATIESVFSRYMNGYGGK